VRLFICLLTNDLYKIDSCLGRYDEEVYEVLMQQARLNSLNRNKVKNRRFQNREDDFSDIYFVVDSSSLVIDEAKKTFKVLVCNELVFSSKLIISRFISKHK
jgi:hypothetical protein